MSRKIGENKFKVGVFSANAWGGLTQTLAPERWQGTWENNLDLALQAEAGGMDFLLPLGQWLGLNGKAPTDGFSFETLTWAAGLLSATTRIPIFSTVHVSFLHPIFAAKQMATCDHIGRGRFGVNIVSGSKKAEFDMFGIELMEHDERYAYTEEWLEIVQRIWRAEKPFDFEGKYFTLRNVEGHPGPYGDVRPIIVSAGSSGAGRGFTARHCDALFMLIVTDDGLSSEISSFREAAGRPVEVFGSSHIFCRQTRREAEEYYRYIVEENGDWAAADTLMTQVFPHSQSIPHARLHAMRERFCSGHGTYRFLGTPDDVVQSFQRLSSAGLDGVAIAMPNYLNDLPIFVNEVLPRMERAGLRGAVAPL